MKNVRFIGLDVHAETIAVAVAEPGGEVRSLGTIPNRAESIGRLERSIDAAIGTLPVKMRSVIEALQSLRGIAKINAVSIIAELGEVSRFEHARQLMGYSGIVSREHSSGDRIRRGAISKAGSAHLRRIVVEAAWV